MTVNYRYIDAPPERVFDTLADGWLFASWVVGASRIRDVDEGWPQAGARIHHSFGLWPAVINDASTCLEWDPPHHFLLRAAAWPTGASHVAIDVKPRRDGCVVRMTEDAVAGPVRFIPKFVLDPVLYARNAETLQRFAFLIEGGAGAHGREAPNT